MIEIDDSLYSRQRYVLGDGAMRKLASCSVLLVGVGGVGVEIAKNLVLAGVKHLSLLDETPCHKHDLACQFFITEKDVEGRKKRSEASLNGLSELNPYVEVSACNHSLLDFTFLQAFQCVIMTEATLEEQEEVDEYCRRQTPAIPFIGADVYGVFSWCFCDFGDSFEVLDEDGEEVKEVFISDVTKANPGVVSTLDGRLHGLVDGNHVTFKEVKSMQALNGLVCPVKVISATKFSIGDTTPESFKAFEGIGIARQVKMKKKMAFTSLKEQVLRPQVVLADTSRLAWLSHLCMLTLHRYKQRHDGNPPEPWDQGSCEEFKRTAQELNSQLLLGDWSSVNQSHVELFSYTCAGQLASMCAYVGGVVAQECLKSLSNKFTPLNQWLYTDAMEVCATDRQVTKLSLPSHLHSRYYREIVCIGEDLFNKLTKQNLFMVGCGAIGCELLKNFALLGISTGEGKLTITDYDLIEKSNLNRQFLFRPKHIRQPKSTVAARSVTAINPDIKIEPHQNKVCWETEASTYTDSFIRHHDVIINALDNVEARKYVDGRCVANQRPLLESGTMATKGHVQVIVPFVTESYVSQTDPDEGGDVPYCTLKSFPSNMDHCIQWAREKFESVFVVKVQSYQHFWIKHPLQQLLLDLQAGKTAPSKSKTALKLALEMTSFSSSSSSSSSPWLNFLALARQKFQKYFNHKAQDLLNAFPLDTRNKDGSLFWQLPKRPPTPLTFNPDDPLHLSFVKSFCKLKASVAGYKPTQEELDGTSIRQALANIQVLDYVFKKKHIETDESVKKPKKNEEEEEEKDDGGADNDDDEGGGEGLGKEEKMVELVNKVHGIFRGENPPPLKAEVFEKDDDSNSHIDLIAAMANLRASTYQIEQKDRLEIKRVAGKIVPAIATTTAAVAALVSVELLKVVKGTEADRLNNCFLNLAICLFVPSQPALPASFSMSNGITYTHWDKWIVKGQADTTLETFLKTLKKTYKLDPVLVVHGVKLVFSVDMAMQHKKRLKKALLSFVKLTDKDYVDLVVSFKKTIDAEGKRLDQNGPPIRFQFN